MRFEVWTKVFLLYNKQLISNLSIWSSNVWLNVGLSDGYQRWVWVFKNSPEPFLAIGNDEKFIFTLRFLKIRQEITLWFKMILLVYLWCCYFYVTMRTQLKRQKKIMQRRKYICHNIKFTIFILNVIKYTIVIVLSK